MNKYGDKRNLFLKGKLISQNNVSLAFKKNPVNHDLSCGELSKMTKLF